ncbi:hypothetical protein B2J88_37075 [Rhodococcus sp. SRB_17]|nr:hypothetical protein [Rhodococcus sp. SRB_17]
MPAAQARQIDLGLGAADAATVPGQRETLRILVRNLLDNAVKYTPAGGRVDVGVRADAGAVVLTVEDSGPGIAPGERARVLDRFYRCEEAQAGEVQGSGLGLAIVQAIAQRHGAELALDASPRLGGLRATVRFAGAAAPQGAA